MSNSGENFDLNSTSRIKLEAQYQFPVPRMLPSSHQKRSRPFAHISPTNYERNAHAILTGSGYREGSYPSPVPLPKSRSVRRSIAVSTLARYVKVIVFMFFDFLSVLIVEELFTRWFTLDFPNLACFFFWWLFFRILFQFIFWSMHFSSLEFYIFPGSIRILKYVGKLLLTCTGK